MITLAIDTSTARGAVALLRDDNPLGEEFFWRIPHPAATKDNLFGKIRDLLKEHVSNSRDIGLVVAGLGPGSFTGIRMGIAAAKGIALPQSLPITGVCSFDSLALAALPQMPRDCSQLCVLCDAKREEIYFALYDRNGRRSRDCSIGTLEAIGDLIHDPIWFVGAEIERYKQPIIDLFGGFASVAETAMYPSATEAGKLGIQRLRGSRGRGDEQVEPLYLRSHSYRKL